MNPLHRRSSACLSVCASASLALLTGCSGAASSSETSVTPPAAPQNLYVVQQNFSSSSPGSEPYAIPASTAILVFPTSSTGSVSPSITITPPAGLLLDTVTADTSGNVYAAGYLQTPEAPAEIAVFPAGSTGAATPSRILTGSNTLLYEPQTLAADSSGQIYVGDVDVSVAVFGAGATGDVAPTRRITGPLTDLFSATFGVAVDANGGIYISQDTLASQEVDAFAPGANGNVAPARVLTGSATGFGVPFGLATDSSNNLYVTYGHETPGVAIFPATADGNVAPSRVISGAATTLLNPTSAAIDSAGNLYVLDIGETASGHGGSPSIKVFSPNASGNAAPASTITSAAWTYSGNATLGIH